MPGQVTGTIGQEEVRLENAATESTLELLVQTMEKVAKGIGIKGKDYAKELKNLKKQSDLVTKNNKLKEEENENLEDLNKQLDRTEKQFKKFGEDVTGVINTIFSSTTVGLDNLANAFSTFGPLGQIAGALTKVVSDNVDTFRELSQSGIDLGDSILSAQVAAARAGLPLDIFAKTVTENSGALALFGAGASDGTKRFTEISSIMRKSGVQQNMMRLGMSMSEVSDYTAGYIEIQTKLGRAQTMTNDQLAAGTESYMLELDQLARITGMTRKEAQDALKQQLADKRVKTVMAGMDEKQRVEYQKTLAALEKANPELAEGFKELVATGGIPITEAGKKFALANPQFAKAAGAFKKGNGTFEELAGTVRKGATTLDGMGQGFKDTAAILSVTGKDMGTGGYYAFMGLNKFGEGLTDAQKEQQAALESEQKAVAGFDQSMTQITNALKMFLLPVVNLVASGLGTVVVYVNKAITAFADISKYIRTSLEEAFGKDVVESFINPLKEFGPILATAVVGLMAFNKALAVKRVAGAVLENAASAGKGTLLDTAAKTAAGTKDKVATTAAKSSAGNLASSMTGLGKGATSLGKGLGSGLQGLLKGVASGLAAFANPATAIGLGAVTLAIMGLAKAFEIASPGFQSFGLLVKSTFEGLSTIMGSIGEGIASVIRAIGDNIMGIINSISGGIGTVIDKVNSFRSAGVDNTIKQMEATTAQIERLGGIPEGSLLSTSQGITSLKLALEGFSPGALEGISAGLGKMFGGDRISEIEKMASAGPGIKNLSDALATLNFSNLDSGKITTILASLDFSKITQAGVSINTLANALASLDFSKLNADSINFDSFSANASKVNTLSAALESANAQIKEMKSPSVAEDIKSTLANVTSTITAALTPTADKGKPAVDRQVTLLSDLSVKLDKLNMNMAELVSIQSDLAPDVKKTAGNTRASRATV